MAELAHLNRQTTAGELLASIAHELSQPLGAILSNTETAELILNLPVRSVEEVKAILADIKRADQRATDIIQRLRRLLTKKTIEAHSFDLNDIVGEVMGILAPQAAAHGITLKARLGPEPLNVKGDRVQLEQVILNLVMNAIDALADEDGDDRRIRVRTHLLDDDTVELSVADNGSGIST